MKNVLRNFMASVLMGAFLLVVSDVSAQQIATIGNNTTATYGYSPISVGGYANWPPTSFRTKGVHIQLMYTADQIKAAGVTGPGMLDSIAWNVSSLPSRALTNYSVKAANSPVTSLNDFITTGFTNVVTIPSLSITNTGWVWIPFTTPFFWNGVDNIVLDICSDTASVNVSGSVYVAYDQYTDNISYEVMNYSANPLCGVYTDPQVESAAQPNIKLAFSSNVPSCSGMPVTGIIKSMDNPWDCAGLSVFLQLTNPPQNYVSYQWQYAVDGGAWKDASNGNATGYLATINQYIKYRLKITCPGSGKFSYSNEITLQATPGMSFAKLPYSQDFESWTSRCSVNEIPDMSWTADPAVGEGSWRREDQGADAGWTDDVTPLYYYPVSSEGKHSARFHTSAGEDGSLSLDLDCSGAGGKELRFDYFNKTGISSTGAGTLTVLLSTDAGATFSDTLAILNPQSVQSASWEPQVIPFTSTSPLTVIKFSARGLSQAGDFDMGIDNLRIYAPCEEAPVAGTVDSTSACQGEGITLSLSGDTKAAGLKYLWQSTINGIAWTDVDSIEHPTTPLNQDTWYRCIVTCSNSEKSDTTAPQLMKVNPFYYCYCASGSTVPSTDINLGNIKLMTENFGDTLLDNGNPLPATKNLDANKHYTNYTNVKPAQLYLDSTYQLALTFFTANGTNVFPQMGGAYIKVYLDYNHDGSYDPATELAYFRDKGPDTFNTLGTFTVPDTAQTGITGMRIVTNSTYSTHLVTPCGPYGYGETEDYLVKIDEAYCTGAVEAGKITSSDAITCPGYAVKLYNTGYEQSAAPFSRIWQSSSNKTSWSDLAGTQDQDSIEQTITADTWYRVKATCLNTSAVSYSDTIKVGLNPLCYCVSYADGGFTGLGDSSDIGGFSIGNFSIPLTGGHLNNPAAVSGYTNHINDTIQLHPDSTYHFSIDHIILRGKHGDAKITMFIDYNANGKFDIPEERVYSAISEATTWHKTDKVTIPSNVSLDVPTGMRVIVNNNTEPNIPSDEGCGIYRSGETEDYVVVFSTRTNDINTVSGQADAMHIYPNPTDGRITVRYNGAAYNGAVIKVQNIVGQVLMQKTVDQLSNGRTIQLDLSNFSRGVYLIRLEYGENTMTGKIVLQ